LRFGERFRLRGKSLWLSGRVFDRKEEEEKKESTASRRSQLASLSACKP
jgi:hypothetical protein